MTLQTRTTLAHEILRRIARLAVWSFADLCCHNDSGSRVHTLRISAFSHCADVVIWTEGRTAGGLVAGRAGRVTLAEGSFREEENCHDDG